MLELSLVCPIFCIPHCPYPVAFSSSFFQKPTTSLLQTLWSKQKILEGDYLSVFTLYCIINGKKVGFLMIKSIFLSSWIKVKKIDMKPCSMDLCTVTWPKCKSMLTQMQLLFSALSSNDLFVTLLHCEAHISHFLTNCKRLKTWSWQYKSGVINGI